MFIKYEVAGELSFEIATFLGCSYLYDNGEISIEVAGNFCDLTRKATPEEYEEFYKVLMDGIMSNSPCVDITHIGMNHWLWLEDQGDEDNNSLEESNSFT